MIEFIAYVIAGGLNNSVTGLSSKMVASLYRMIVELNASATASLKGKVAEENAKDITDYVFYILVI